MSQIYKTFELAKTGYPIPIFQSGKPMHSKYNPEKEAETFVQNISKSDFFIILGIGGGFHIQKLAETFPKSKIIGVEFSCEDIDFLKQHSPICKNLAKKENVIFTSLTLLEKTICENWITAVFPSLSIIEYKSWTIENANITEKIKKIIRETISKISADYSVQVHFGKIWMHNILNNLKYNVKKSLKVSDIKIIKNEKAIVLAAGPSLDSKIKYLKENSNICTIISTDTAYKTLLQHNINVDFVCSVDAQNVSTVHFLGKNNNPNTTFIFDLTSNPSAPKKLLKDGQKVVFTNSGHPLISYIESICEKNFFEKLQTGSGTVTIAALDFAKKLGFSNIEILGADFSYPNAKPYCKGTYLEQTFTPKINKFLPIETFYNKLMFRTKLIKINKYATTEILNSYKISFETWLFENKFQYKNENFVYFAKKKSCKTEQKIFHNFDYEDFKKRLQNELFVEKNHKTNPFFLTNFEKSMLPYISYLQEKKKIKDFAQLLNLALYDFVRYT